MRKFVLAIFLIALIAALSAGCAKGAGNVPDVLHEESSAGNQEPAVETPADQPVNEEVDMDGAEETETGEEPAEEPAQEEPDDRWTPKTSRRPERKVYFLWLYLDGP